jgi:hypothetical protein
MADPDGFTPDGFEPDQPQSRATALYQRFAAPVTSAVAKAGQYTPIDLGQMALSKLTGGMVPSPQPTASNAIAQRGAEFVVPQTPVQAAIAAGTLGAGPLISAGAKAGVPLAGSLAASPALGRILGGTVGGALGGYAEEPTAGGAARGAALGAGSTALGEGIGKAFQLGRRILPGGKAAINEEAARRVADVAQTVNPAAAAPIQAARAGLRPLKGATTPAALQEAVLSGQLQNAASGQMEQFMTGLPQNLRAQGPAIQAAYDAMPDLAKQYLVGQVGPGGFTVPQAQAIRGWLGGGAFSQSPLGQGVGKVPQQKLWADVTREIEAALGPTLTPSWATANQEYGGLSVLQDALSQANAFTGGPNRIALNTPAIQQWLSLNREEAQRRMGQPAFDALANAFTGGGQLGTRDILAPGFGGALDALRQVYGRGQGGAPQLIGSVLRTAVPNIGSQHTGRAPLQLPPALQQILDLAVQRGTQEAAHR